MTSDVLDRPVVRMPSFGAGTWLGTPGPLTPAGLRGQVVLVDFWDYTCVNCVRTLPYLRTWHERYADKGLVIIGVHAPEFKFAQDPGQITAAIADFRLPYPVLIDNEYETWQRFANRAWPTKYLVDDRGYIRLKRQGEGDYGAIEAAIQALLRALHPAVNLPDLLPALRPEDAAGAVCYRATPELHAGYGSGGLRGSALGNGDVLAVDRPAFYQLPALPESQPGRFYAAGFWQLTAEALVFTGQSEGKIRLLYEAAGVNAVLSPSSDLVALRLGLLSEAPPLLRVTLDGAPLPVFAAGADIIYDDAGHSLVQLTRPRLYELVRTPDFRRGLLELTVQTPGVALFTFTFVTCVAAATTDSATFQMG